MSAGEYFAWVLGGLALGLVCLMGTMWLGSLARQAWKEESERVRARRAAHGGETPNRKTRRALAAANRGEVEHCKDVGNLMRQIRSGRMGL